MQFDDKQRKRADPIVGLSEQVLFPSFDIDFCDEGRKSLGTLAADNSRDGTELDGASHIDLGSVAPFTQTRVYDRRLAIGGSDGCLVKIDVESSRISLKELKVGSVRLESNDVTLGKTYRKPADAGPN